MFSAASSFDLLFAPSTYPVIELTLLIHLFAVVLSNQQNSTIAPLMTASMSLFEKHAILLDKGIPPSDYAWKINEFTEFSCVIYTFLLFYIFFFNYIYIYFNFFFSFLYFNTLEPHYNTDFRVHKISVL